MIRTEVIKKDGKFWLHGWGNTEAPIMIVASHPSRDDLNFGQLLGYDSMDAEQETTAAEELHQALSAVDIDIDTDCWVTAMVKHGIGSKDKPDSTQIAAGFEELDQEIAEVKPKLIITLGAEAFKRIMKTNIGQSDYLGEIIDSPYGKLLANYSPGQVLRIDPTLRPEFIANFALAKKFIDDELHYTNYETLVITDPEENKVMVQECINQGLFTVGYDLEWKGKYMKDEILYSFQYSVTPDRAIVLPLVTAENPTVENLELLNTMKPLLEHPKADRLGWNIRADDKRLVAKGFNLSDSTLGFDGMKAVAFFDSRWGKGLEFGIKKFTNYRPYYNKFFMGLREHKLKKEEMSDMLFKDRDLFIEYAGGDAVAHREACVNMRDKMNKDLPRHVRKYFFEAYLPLTHYLTDMEVTGMPIDIEFMSKITDQYAECYRKIEESLLAKTKAVGFDSERRKKMIEELGAEAIQAFHIYEDFNPRSYIDKSVLFFDVMELTPAYYVKKGKTKPAAWYDKQKDAVKAQYKPSTNGKCIASIRFKLKAELEKMKALTPDQIEDIEAHEGEFQKLQRNYEIVRDYLDLSRVGVFSGKFLSKQGISDGTEDEEEDQEETLKSSYWAALGKGEKIYPDFYECLDNFRSSSKPNVQNPASKVLSNMPEIFERMGMEAPKNIRNLFYSGSKDWHFAEVDVAGADLAIAAFLSGDPKYKQDILNGGFHLTKMREYFKDPSLSKSEASKYVTAKAITFRVAYTAGLMSAGLPIQAEIFAESGNYVNLDLIEYALNTWKRYEIYMDYRQRCQEEVETRNQISNLRGMVYKFEKTSNFAIKAGWLNQSLAYPIASELALFMWDISVKMKEYLKKQGEWMKWIKPINCVHDANYWVVHKDMMKDNYFPEVCRNFFTKEVKIATGDCLGIEMVVADRWKGKEKVFDNETVWDPEGKCWNWKH